MDYFNFDCPTLFAVPPSGGNSACPAMNIQPIFQRKPGRQANRGQSNYRTFARIACGPLVACLLIFVTGCQKSASEASKTAAVAAAKTTHPVSEADLNTIELTEDAVRRLGLQTEVVTLRAMPRARAYGAELMLPA